MVFADLAHGTVSVEQLPGQYGPEFWPQDFLSCSCKLDVRNVTLLDEFGGNFRDGTQNASRFVCGNGMLAGAPLTTYTDSGGNLIRFVIEQKLPLFNAQVWDVMLTDVFGTPLPDSFFCPKQG